MPENNLTHPVPKLLPQGAPRCVSPAQGRVTSRPGWEKPPGIFRAGNRLPARRRGGGSRHHRGETALQRADPRPARLRRPAPRLPRTRDGVTVPLNENQHFIPQKVVSEPHSPPPAGAGISRQVPQARPAAIINMEAPAPPRDARPATFYTAACLSMVSPPPRGSSTVKAVIRLFAAPPAGRRDPLHRHSLCAATFRRSRRLHALRTPALAAAL